MSATPRAPVVPVVPGRARSSRAAAADAGWGACTPVTPVTIPPAAGRSRRLSWASPRALWECRNQVIGQVLRDPSPAHRNRWLQTLGISPTDRLVVDGLADRARVSFVVMGDTGEGDDSQYRVVPTLLSVGEGTDFLFLCSDIVYPAGGLEEYGPKVLGPYRDYAGSIYGIPGNHCWFDDADGFMYWFCKADQRPPRPPGSWWRLSELLWRRSPQGRTARLVEMAAVRPAPAGSQYDDHRHLQIALRPPAGGRRRGHDGGGPRPDVRRGAHDQPGPYFALDAGADATRVRLVALDLGVDGPLDRRQAQWLLRTSAEPGPKILLLELPLYDDGGLQKRSMEGGGTIYDVVADGGHEYLAVVSGNTHNYQRYLVTLPDRRQMPFIVCGGGGAFLHETHTIPNLDHAHLDGVDEASFRCYPARGDSLARCAQLWDRKLATHGLLSLDPDVAASLAGERIGVEPLRAAARDATPTPRDRLVASLMYRLPSRPHALMHTAFSSLLDWGVPPLFKHVLRVDLEPGQVSITCYAATGCRHHVADPPIEDRLVGRRDRDRWRWQVEA